MSKAIELLKDMKRNMESVGTISVPYHISQIKEAIAELEKDQSEVERLKGTLKRGLELCPGWREVIAELDDMPKSEVLGKAMWACLDQIDIWRKEAKQALKGGGQAEAKGDLKNKTTNQQMPGTDS